MNGVDTTYTKKILIVDDEPYIVRVLKLKLENAGYEVLTAVNGIDGMEKYVKENPAVVITDIVMPHVNGQELYKMIETQRKKNPCFVIVMTSSIDGSIRRWAEEMSNIYFVEKPFSPKDMLNLINECFSRLQVTNATR